ncbi:hypothetical protein BJX96DRAFT_170287 [Aspergillus floccosus]
MTDIRTNFHSLPCEIFRLIFSQCEKFSQFVSLARSCKRLHNYYITDIDPMIYPLAQRNLLCFDDAWITARATREVIKCYKKGEHPPTPFPLHTLSGAPDERITLDDMKDNSKWEHLLDCIEGNLLSDALLDNTGVYAIRPRAYWTAWRRNLRRSIYRLFFMGAVLCRTYQEPFQTSGPNAPNGFLEDCAYRLVKNHARVLREDEIKHLLTYSALHRGACYETFGLTLKRWRTFSWNEPGLEHGVNLGFYRSNPPKHF